jgi:hypothetical protein
MVMTTANHEMQRPRCFGSNAQQRMQRTAHHLWPLLRQDPTYGYEGRMIGVDGATIDDLPALVSLTSVQGASVSHYVPLKDEAALTRAVTEAGLATDRWDQFMGGMDCLNTCRDIAREFRVPNRYTLRVVQPGVSDALLTGLSETALASGVLPPDASVLFGQSRDAVCYVLEATDGGVAACAGAVMRNHPRSRYGAASWWGMLATRQADRGQGLSLYLGARAALHMHEQFGADTFYTGVRTDNAVSRHLCTKLGMVESDYACLAILDPEFFGEGGFTK